MASSWLYGRDINRSRDNQVETKAYAYVIKGNGKTSKQFERILLNEKTIWSGDILRYETLG